MLIDGRVFGGLINDFKLDNIKKFKKYFMDQTLWLCTLTAIKQVTSKLENRKRVISTLAWPFLVIAQLSHACTAFLLALFRHNVATSSLSSSYLQSFHSPSSPQAAKWPLNSNNSLFPVLSPFYSSFAQFCSPTQVDYFSVDFPPPRYFPFFLVIASERYFETRARKKSSSFSSYPKFLDYRHFYPPTPDTTS